MLLLVAALQTGCATAPHDVAEHLDPETGVTATTVGTPMQFVYAMPAYGAHARQLMQLGVFEINRSGDYRYFVWLGSWSTSPTVSAMSQRDQLESVVLFVDGEPISLSLTGWAPNAAGLSRPAFTLPVASAVEAYYQVTPDVLRMIAASKQLSIEAGGARSRRFEPWDAQPAARRDLENFVISVLPAR